MSRRSAQTPALLLALALAAWPAAARPADAGATSAGDPGGGVVGGDAVHGDVTRGGGSRPAPGAGGGLGVMQRFDPAQLHPDLFEPRPRTGPRSPALTAAVESLSVQGAVMGWNRFVGAAPWATVTPRSVGDNLRSRWVLDGDAYFINQLGHPYQGTFSYSAARSAGLGFWSSTAYPFAASALWELAGETERPSINDQVTTTVAGIVLGEILFRASDWIRGDGRSPWRQAAATVHSPMATLNRTVVGGGPRETPQPSRLTAGAGVLATTSAPRGDAVAPGAAAAFGLRLTHGVPGAPETAFERPFDHFDVAALFAPTPDPVMVVRARGLLLGDGFAEDETGGGLWGLWLSFDLDSPGARRVSTSALGVGATGRWLVQPGLTAEWTAVGSAVLLGATGVTPGVAGSDRDYRFGPGAQAVLEGRLAFGDRFETGLALRPYLVVAAGLPGGSDLVVNGDLSARLRVHGHHALEATATRFLRRAHEADGAVTRQSGGQVLLSWIWAMDPPRQGVRDDLDPDA